jgi:hypothetical protein
MSDAVIFPVSDAASKGARRAAARTVPKFVGQKLAKAPTRWTAGRSSQPPSPQLRREVLRAGFEA